MCNSFFKADQEVDSRCKKHDKDDFVEDVEG